MLAWKNLYAELRLRPSASASEIRTAYRRAALQAHPDKGGSTAAFRAIALAYEILSCPASRELYDRSRGQRLKRKHYRPHHSECPSPDVTSRAEVPKTTATQKTCAAFAQRKRASAATSSRPAQQQPAASGSGVGEGLSQPKAAEAHEGAGDVAHAATTAARHGEESETSDAMTQLRAALQPLPPVQRRAAIAHMSPRGRAELLAHMSCQRTPEVIATAKGPGGDKKQLKRCGQGGSWSRGTDIRTIKHIHKTIYQVQLRLRHLRMYTRGQADIETAISHQMVLIRARHAIEAAGEELWNDPQRFCQVFTGTLTSAGISPEQLGLSVFVFMRADEWICRCATITSPILALGDAVAVHARLLLARRTSWARLRAEWVPLMRRTRQARRQQLSQAQAEALADRARRLLLERRLGRAVRAAERAAGRRARREQRAASAGAQVLRRAAKEKAAAAAKRRRLARREQRERLAARRRWYRRADLTTEEIMRGAPPHLWRLPQR